MNTHLAIPVVVGALLTACAHGSGGNGAERAPRPDPNIITAEELGRTTATTLYDAVRALRPAWMLRSRPTAVLQVQQAQLIVYVDGTRYGTMESLRQFGPNGIVSVRYYSAGDAQARFGPGHLLGAIEVTTMSR